VGNDGTSEDESNWHCNGGTGIGIEDGDSLLCFEGSRDRFSGIFDVDISILSVGDGDEECLAAGIRLLVIQCDGDVLATHSGNGGDEDLQVFLSQEAAIGETEFCGDGEFHPVSWWNWFGAVITSVISWSAYWVVIEVTFGSVRWCAKWAEIAALSESLDLCLFWASKCHGACHQIAIINWFAVSTALEISPDEYETFWASGLWETIHQRAIWNIFATRTTFSGENDQLLTVPTRWVFAPDQFTMEDWFTNKTTFPEDWLLSLRADEFSAGWRIGIRGIRGIRTTPSCTVDHATVYAIITASSTTIPR